MVRSDPIATQDTSDDTMARVARWGPVVAVGASLLFAVVVQSALFARSSWIMGDLAYHRGVAYTMQGGDFQGEGPYAGLITYYGGLFPLAISFVASVLGTTFDNVLSVISWLTPLAWPLALVALGWRLFPGRPWATAILVVLGTVAAPLTTNQDGLWVESMLPSGSTFWPLYPRDVALVLIVLTIVAVTADRRAVRILGTGAGIGFTILFHAQLGFLTAGFVTAWSIWRALRTRDWRRFVEPAGIGLIALAVSAWWLLPRAFAVGESGQLLLADLPGRPILRLDASGFLVAFGAIGVLAVVAIVASRWMTAAPLARELALAWTATFAPLIVVDRLWEGIDLFSERRIWLVLSIGFLILATTLIVELVVQAREVRGRWRIGPALASTLVAVVVLSSLPATAATIELASTQWRDGSVGGERVAVPEWRTAMTTLHDRVLAGEHPVVATYDGFGAWVWSFSGVRVPALWLPGFVKLGFDPGPLTGAGQVERIRLVGDAFDDGLTGICSLRSSLGVDTLMLEVHDGLVGTYQHSFGGPYRVPPEQRDVGTAKRSVGPGETYLDHGTYDGLLLTAGTSVTVPWNTRAIQRVELLVDPARSVEGDAVEVRSGRQVLEAIEETGEGPRTRLVFETAGVRPRMTITALRSVELIRVIGYETLALPDQSADGFAVERADDVCADQAP